MNNQISTKNFTIYLIKESITELDNIIDEKKVEHQENIQKGSERIGTLFIKKAEYKIPRWANVFNGYIDTKKIGKGGNPSALLLIKVEGRLFAVTFGQGRYILVQDCWEERFGLLVALNVIKESSIKSLDKKTFDAISLNTREQASKGIGAEEFGLDIEKDLLRAVVGLSQDKTLGERVSGMDSFKTAVRANLDDLKELCKNILKKSEDLSYKDKYPWVDHLQEVKDKKFIESLDTELIRYINEEKFDKCWTSVPEIINWHSVDGFKYGFSSRSPIHYDIHLPEFIEEKIKDEEITIDKIKNRKVYAVTEDDITIDSWSIYKCLYSEVLFQGRTFILNNGKWYEVDKDFVQIINKYFNAIPKCNLSLPDYNHNSEREYNEYASSQGSNFALMDRVIVDKVEFCDLYGKDKNIIHVKRYGASSVLSHLFMQGLNSAELFQTDAGFRKRVNAKLPETHKFQNIDEIPLHKEYEIVYAIISDSDGDELELPFFSKLTLRNAVKRLTAFGFKVSLKKFLLTKTKNH